jgi:hypothetical protein
VKRIPIKVTVVTSGRTDLRSLQFELLRRQLPCGGWAALASSSQPAVEPTCYSLLALTPPAEQTIVKAQHFLLRAQNSMLRDRACPQGGWNAGNGVVYGEPVAPHPDDSAIALLALSERAHDPAVEAGLAYLKHVAPSLAAPWSLAWAILALAAHHRPIAALESSLTALPGLINTEDNSTLALVCLALDHQRALAAFGVTA